MRTRQIQFLRPDEILAEMQKIALVYMPVGLLEWHGPHLPFGVDSFNAESVALLAAEQTGGLVMPTLYLGTERERPPEMLKHLGFEGDEWIVGMDFPANTLPSMYVREDILALVIRENLRLAAEMGFKTLVLITGHGATNQIETLKRVAAEFNATGKVNVLVELPFVVNDEGILAVGHASRIETSIMMALHPETVRLDQLPDSPQPLKNVDFAIVDYLTFLGQPTNDHTIHAQDDPRQASAAEGRETLQKAAAQIVECVKAAVTG